MIRKLAAPLIVGLLTGYPAKQPKPSISSSSLTPTIGEVCQQTVVAEDETYFRDNMTCVEMHTVETAGDFNGWIYVHVIGLNSEAIFKTQENAEIWAKSQPYVRPAWQVR